MNDDFFDSQERKLKEKRREKVENFRMNIDDDYFSDIPNSEIDYKKSDEIFSSHENSRRDRRKKGAYGNRPNNYNDIEENSPSNELNSFSGEETKEKLVRDSIKAGKIEKKIAKKRDRQKSKQNRLMFRIMWICMVVIAGAVLASYMITGVNDMLAVGRTDNPKKVTVTIPKDASIDTVAKLFKKQGIINEVKAFKTYAKLTKSSDSLQQGKYEMDTDMDYEAIINYIQSMQNRIDTLKVQITEGMSVEEIAQKLKKEGVLEDTSKFLNLCNSDDFDDSYSFLKNQEDRGDRYYKLEGYLFPDTYEFYKNEDPDITISRFLDNFENKVVNTTETVSGYKNKVSLLTQAEKKWDSLDEVMTIASIIQAEAANEKDMYYISSILHNRIDAGEASDVAYLSLDSTLYYPYRDKNSVPKNIRKSFSSTYDTYKIKGLPPGPICNPSLEAIKAAIYPYSTSYYYFCHSSDGTAYYATNYYDHQYYLSIIS